jgi:hypothetical protein
LAIPESQLETWSHQGAIVASRDTYAAVRGVLDDKRAPYKDKKAEIFLQGSYANDTNVFKESDVDVVIRTDNVYYYDLSRLSEFEKARFWNQFSKSEYSQVKFKDEVGAWLGRHFPGVRIGSKAIKVPGDGKRRDADVLAAARLRLYHNYPESGSPRTTEGICFFVGGKMVVNFPKQHISNCISKHQGTASWFKPTVRVFKNVRNHLVSIGEIQKKEAPSYFLEGMLHNVPSSFFGTDYRSTFIRCHQWLQKCAPEKLMCANGVHQLIDDTSDTSWSFFDFRNFLQKSAVLWDQW